ncbi:OmpP1/FadL family transporter [Helicobacter sp. T3_23-1059]
MRFRASRFFALFWLNVLVFSAFFGGGLGCANGFKIQEQSLNATALSSAYIAGARGADASYYNPANMGFKNDWGENKSEFELATSLIRIPGFSFDVPTTNQGLYSKTKLTFTDTMSSTIDTIHELFPGIGLGSLKAPIILDHTSADSQIITGSTGDTNFILPKFFYKTRTNHGITLGFSFVASSGLAMEWAGKGGEFLQDVFIMMVEASPSISWTVADRFSIGFGLRGMYAMGKFNNVVYVPLDKDGKGISLTTDQIVNLAKHPESLKILIPESIRNGFVGDVLKNSTVQSLLKLLGIDLRIDGCTSSTEPTQAINCVNWGALMNDVKTETTNLYGTSKVYQKSEGSDLSVGYRLAFSMRVVDNGMFSVVFNSPVAFDMRGEVKATTYVGGAMGNVLTTAPLKIDVQMPEILTVAYAQDFFAKRVRLEGVYERTFWSRGWKFRVTPDFENAKYEGLSGLVSYRDVWETQDGATLKNMVGIADFGVVSNMGAGWRDTNTFRLGATYLGKKNRLMGSVAYDAAPSPQDKIGIPDSDGYMVGIGLKRNFKGFDFGLAGSWTYKASMSSMYHSGGLGGLYIYTASLGYRW